MDGKEGISAWYHESNIKGSRKKIIRIRIKYKTSKHNKKNWTCRIFQHVILHKKISDVNQLETQNLLKLRYVFLDTFKVKTMHYLYSSHHMEPFDTKIDCFSGYNRHQRPLSLSTPESDDSLFLPTKQNWKIRKIKFSTNFFFWKLKGPVT